MNSLGPNFQPAEPNRRWAIKATAALGFGACLSRTSAQASSLDETKGASAREWWTWRGPNGNNIAPAGSSAPTSYGADHLFWETRVPGRGHSSPIVAGNSIYLTTADKTAGSQSVLAYSCDNGKPLWSQVIHNTGLPKELVYDGHVYAVTDAGIAHCWRAKDGETLWRERLGGDYSCSPVLVGETIHVFNEQGQGFAFKANPKGYESMGGGKIADDVFATPSVVGNTMFMRLAKNLSGVRQEFLVALR